MTHNRDTMPDDDLGAKRLASLPAIPAGEFANWEQDVGRPQSPVAAQRSPFGSVQEYRFCKAVVETPMQPSSAYVKLAKLSCKMAGPIRTRLVAAGYIREHAVQTNIRGRSSILLEALLEGKAAVELHEKGKGA